jgi:inositol-phosphate phosphatase/L-galactose 1-phosphate phosphatase
MASAAPPQQLDLLRCLDVAKHAAAAAGAIIQAAFHQEKRIQEKSTHVDLVTETDKKCEQVIHDLLAQHFPAHKFIGEEAASASGGQPPLTDEPTWMVRVCGVVASDGWLVVEGCRSG